MTRFIILCINSYFLKICERTCKIFAFVKAFQFVPQFLVVFYIFVRKNVIWNVTTYQNWQILRLLHLNFVEICLNKLLNSFMASGKLWYYSNTVYFLFMKRNVVLLGHLFKSMVTDPLRFSLLTIWNMQFNF